MFINLTNHPSAGWSKEQLEAAQQYGEIADIPFPDIRPEASTEEVHQLAEGFIEQIKPKMTEPAVVHIMGEMTFTFYVVSRLKEMGIRCVASTTERVPLTIELPDGTIIKKFKFVQFRDY